MEENSWKKYELVDREESYEMLVSGHSKAVDVINPQ